MAKTHRGAKKAKRLGSGTVVNRASKAVSDGAVEAALINRDGAVLAAKVNATAVVVGALVAGSCGVLGVGVDGHFSTEATRIATSATIGNVDDRDTALRLTEAEAGMASAAQRTGWDPSTPLYVLAFGGHYRFDGLKLHPLSPSEEVAMTRAPAEAFSTRA